MADHRAEWDTPDATLSLHTTTMTPGVLRFTAADLDTHPDGCFITNHTSSPTPTPMMQPVGMESGFFMHLTVDRLTVDHDAHAEVVHAAQRDCPQRLRQLWETGCHGYGGRVPVGGVFGVGGVDEEGEEERGVEEGALPLAESSSNGDHGTHDDDAKQHTDCDVVCIRAHATGPPARDDAPGDDDVGKHSMHSHVPATSQPPPPPPPQSMPTPTKLHAAPPPPPLPHVARSQPTRIPTTPPPPPPPPHMRHTPKTPNTPPAFISASLDDGSNGNTHNPIKPHAAVKTGGGDAETSGEQLRTPAQGGSPHMGTPKVGGGSTTPGAQHTPRYKLLHWCVAPLKPNTLWEEVCWGRHGCGHGVGVSLLGCRYARSYTHTIYTHHMHKHTPYAQTHIIYNHTHLGTCTRPHTVTSRCGAYPTSIYTSANQHTTH